jgi:ADP-ribose pyrophosphatase YjhB (NUDIX family)
VERGKNESVSEPLSHGSGPSAERPASRLEPADRRTEPAPAFPQAGKLKHLVVVGYIVHEGKVLLVWHEKLGKWLPPGGHVEEGELPTEAVIREVLEETGYAVSLRNRTSPGGNEKGVLVLPVPHHIQVEYIDGRHDHLDLAYECCLVNPNPAANGTSKHRWFTEGELSEFGVGENVRHFSRMLLRTQGEPSSAVG